MNAMPSGLREELVASRTLSTSGILFKVLRNYQPGGAAEKTETLQALTVAKSAKTPRDAVEQLRKWRRHQLRAEELGVVLPDCSILIKALTAMVQDVLAGASQASFRVNSFRMQCHLDTKPSPTNMESYYQMVLAEMENLVLAPETVATGGGPSTSATTTPTVKMVQGAGKGGTKNDTGLQLCRSWGSENGCRFGKSCKFAHPALPDSRERCWNCSATTHQKLACPYNKQNSPGNPMSTSGGSERGDRDGGGGRGGREGRGGKTNNKGGKGSKGDQGHPQDDGKGKGDGSSEDKRAASMSTAKKEDESARDLENRGSEQPTTGSTGETTATAGESALLTEVTSLLRSLRSSGQGSGQRGPAVRVAYVKKLDPTENTSYLLDGGATHPLRQCRNRAEWNAATPTVVNLALGEATLRQKENGTLLTEEHVQPIIPVQDLTMIGVKVTWVDGVCRMTLQGSKLGVYMDQGCPCVGAVEGKRLMEQVEEMHTRRAALRSVRDRPREADTTEDERSLRFFFNLFPDVPQYIAEKVIGYADYDTSRLPWNRKVRRRIEEASCLILHLYSGKNKAKWKELEYDEHAEHGDTPSIVVLCVDVEHGGDLHNPHLMGYLENLARHGRLAMLIGGPPCRTVSAARLRDDGGPRAVRGRGKGTRWGLSRNTAYEQNLCNGDSALWLKMCWLAVLGKNGNPEMETLIEQPQDPEEWQAPFRPRPEFGIASYLTWPETWMTKEIASLSEVRFDQGTVGHDYCKPTTLLTDVEEMKQLDGQRVAQGMTQGWPGYLKDRMNEAKMAAEWAPGLCDLIKTAIRRKWGQSRWRTTPGSQRRGALPQMARGPARAAALGNGLKQDEKAAAAMWAAHYQAGHVPFRRDCAVCLEAAGRDRPRKAVPHPSAYTWSLDLMGPFVESHDQELPYARYGLVTVVTIPTREELPVVRGPQELGARVPPSRKRALPQWTEDDAVQDDEVGDWEAQVDPWVEPLTEAEIKKAEVLAQEWKEFLKEAKDVGEMKTLTFVHPVKSRSAKDILYGITRIYARIQALQIPILRAHMDREKSFVSKEVTGWMAQQGLYCTYTAGDEPCGNARAEREIGVLRGRCRALMKSTRLDPGLWALAFRQAGEERLRDQLWQVGVVTPTLLPFGSRAMVKKKTWFQRADPWKWPMTPVTLLGPAGDMSLTSGGYYCRDNEGRFFRSTVVVIPKQHATTAQALEAELSRLQEVEESQAQSTHPEGDGLQRGGDGLQRGGDVDGPALFEAEAEQSCGFEDPGVKPWGAEDIFEAYQMRRSTGISA